MLRLLPLVFVVALLASCLKQSTNGDGKPSPFQGEANRFDPTAYAGTVWLGDSEARNERLLVDETGAARIMLASSIFWLRPAEDTFVLESRLYRTMYDEEPALTASVGEARLLSDGSICRLEVLSDPWHSFSREQETVLFYLSAEPPEEDQWYFIDYINSTMTPYDQPNTQWSLQDNKMGLELASDDDGRVTGTCIVRGERLACELLIGHHGWNVDCALVKKEAQSAEDVLLYGWMDKGTERRYGSQCRIVLQYDPLGLCGEKDELILRKQTTFDLSEQNWLGMNVYELLFWMEQEGWRAEPFTLFDNSSPSFFFLRRGEQTVLLSYGDAFDGFHEYYVLGYARYNGRDLRSWAGLRPIDPEAAEAYAQTEIGRFSDFVESPGYTHSLYYYYFLNDCRAAAVKHETSGYWDESEFTMYDLYRAE